MDKNINYNDFWTSIGSILDCFVVCSAVRDEDGGITDFLIEYVNDAACECYKISREEQLSKKLQELFPFYKKDVLFDEFCKVDETGKPFAAQGLIIEDGYKGKKISITVDIKVIKMNDGFAINWREITDKKKVEEALQESEEKFRSAFENASIGMAITSIDCKWLKVNRSLCEMTGYNESEMLSMTFQDMTHPDDVSMNLGYFEQALEGKISYYHIEKRFIHKDGHTIWTVLSSSLIRDNKGKPLYFSSQIQDITKIKQAADALEYDKLKTEFFANLSHELRTPIAIIFSTLQLINQYADNGTLKGDTLSKYTGIMKQNCYRLIRLTNNLIDATKIDAGFYDLQLQNCNIVSVVENITLSVADYISSKGIELLFDTDTEEKIIACDPDIIERIMLNLLSNAVKFTKRNGKIEVLVKEEPDFISIKVKDNGMGIKKDKLRLIFERFRQADKSLTRRREGSGIGLSLVKSLVEMHEGEISVKSSYGHGSEFMFRLPDRMVEECDTADLHANSKIGGDYTERINIEFSDIYI
jgi:PAS domain S-box-containing protein